MKINDLQTITDDVVEAARSTLVMAQLTSLAAKERSQCPPPTAKPSQPAGRGSHRGVLASGAGKGYAQRFVRLTTAGPSVGRLLAAGSGS